ncbi:unnamed protein product [Absidia cylindrospora]
MIYAGALPSFWYLKSIFYLCINGGEVCHPYCQVQWHEALLFRIFFFQLSRSSESFQAIQRKK